MIKIAFASIVLIGTLSATTALAEEDCLTANAERPDREAYCFKQAQDAALQATKDKLNQDFQNSLKKNKPQPAEPGAAAAGGAAAPDESTANPTTTPKTTDTVTTPAAASQNQIEGPVTNSTKVTTPTEQIVKPGSDAAVPDDPKRVLPKPKTHPPIQYY